MFGYLIKGVPKQDLCKKIYCFAQTKQLGSLGLQRKSKGVLRYGTNGMFMRNISHILQCLKDYKGFKTSTELAAYLGVSKSALSNWIKRGALDERLIQSRMPEVRLEFLRTGEMPMTEQGDMIQFLLRKIEILERKIEKLEKYGKEK